MKLFPFLAHRISPDPEDLSVGPRFESCVLCSDEGSIGWKAGNGGCNCAVRDQGPQSVSKSRKGSVDFF